MTLGPIVTGFIGSTFSSAVNGTFITMLNANGAEAISINDERIVFDNDNKLIDMECSCPYHQHCKHEAAVIYSLMDSVKKEEEVGEGTYQRIVSSINDAFQRKSLNGLRKAKEELITLKDKMSYEELEKATSLFVATCYKAFYYGEVDGG